MDNVSTMSSFAKSKEFAKIKEENLKAINSSQINEEKGISCPFFSGKLLHRCPIIHFRTMLSRVLNLLLIFHQISGSCSYKKECMFQRHSLMDLSHLQTFSSEKGVLLQP